jgi:hypothetical protein
MRNKKNSKYVYLKMDLVIMRIADLNNRKLMAGRRRLPNHVRLAIRQFVGTNRFLLSLPVPLC